MDAARLIVQNKINSIFFRLRLVLALTRWDVETTSAVLVLYVPTSVPGTKMNGNNRLQHPGICYDPYTVPLVVANGFPLLASLPHLCYSLLPNASPPLQQPLT